MNNSYLNSLQNISKNRVFTKGEAVFHVGDQANAIFKVLKGEVHLYRHNQNGSRVLLYRAFDGNYFAEASLNSDVYHCTAECVKHSEIQIIDAPKMLELLGQHSEFSSQWILSLSSELRRQRASVERLHIKSAVERVKHFIMTEGDSRGGVLLRGSLSDLSEVLGLSRESLYRTLSKMEKAGELDRNGHSLRLK